MAAGSGRRFGEQKQFKQLKGVALYYHSLRQFLICKEIYEIILVVPQARVKKTQNELTNIKTTKKIIVTAGGKKRQESVKKGILRTSNITELVCIHDGARPFVSEDLIKNSIYPCFNNDGAIIALPNYDTLKVCVEGHVKKTIDRKNVWRAQTPQTFWKMKLLDAFAYVEKNELFITDEASIMEAFGFQISVVHGHYNNFKITSPIDWQRAEEITL